MAQVYFGLPEGDRGPGDAIGRARGRATSTAALFFGRSVVLELFADHAERLVDGVGGAGDGDDALGHGAVRYVDLGTRLFSDVVDDLAPLADDGADLFAVHNHPDGKHHVGRVVWERFVNVRHLGLCVSECLFLSVCRVRTGCSGGVGRGLFGGFFLFKGTGTLKEKRFSVTVGVT